ncbi:MAG: 2,3-bisphosphoglycerate-independent phosphoglycerate mutase [Saprospiraceae bacterium]|nr:2,3-bisphosphoglycerate-independent phosphoglycerate mutase [Saprospiraceae bacterium]
MPVFRRTGLIILDGWGLGPDPAADAIARANTPVFDRLMRECPHATLTTFGEAVGLPAGQMGNSEVGHLNIGAGRIVWQELARINKAIAEGELERHSVLQRAFALAREGGRTLHVLGLVSDGGVHAHIDHLLALCDMASRAGLPSVRIHAFTDGRDTGPETGAGFIQRLEQHLAGQDRIRLATIIGRYYAMDRDQRWGRIRRAYDLLIRGDGTPFRTGAEALRSHYDRGITDEFVEPSLITDDGNPVGLIREDDVVLFANFRTDRPRQLTRALTQEALPEWGMHPLPLHFFTMTRYDETFRGVEAIFEKDDLQDTLGEVLSKNGKSQLRLAETEKYPHVTYFFSGGREAPFPGETRRVIPSPQVATYDLKPEMSAPEVTRALLEAFDAEPPDFFCLNFANTDMVGHTGVMEAAIQAAESVDQCLGLLLPAAASLGYGLLIIADHGNADCMIMPDGTPHTAHTMNPVPVIWVDPEHRPASIRDGKLADIAPTLLAIAGLEIPAVMDGDLLIENAAE